MAYDERLAVRIRRVLAKRSDMTERRMFGGLSFLRDGRMCAGVIGQDLVVRIVDEEMPSALRRPHVRPMDFTGRPMRGFVYVGPRAIETEDALREWINKGLSFTEREATPKRLHDQTGSSADGPYMPGIGTSRSRR